MGKSYYTGVPSLNQQFGPMVVNTVGKTMSRTRNHRQTPDHTGAALIMFIVGIPFLPIWSGMMMLGELVQRTRYKPGSKQYEEKSRNIGFAAVCFVIGLFMYSILFNF